MEASSFESSIIYYLLSWFILFGYWPMLLGSEAKSSHYKL